MTERKLKVLLVSLFILVGILYVKEGYNWYQYYKMSKLAVTPSEMSEEEQQAQEEQTNIEETSVMGKIKSISDDKIVIIDEKDKEQSFKIADGLKVEKLGPIDDQGSSKFEETDKSELKQDIEVWVFFEKAEEGEDRRATIIKIMTMSEENMPVPIEKPE